MKHRAIAVGDLAAFAWSTVSTGRDSPTAMDLTQVRHVRAAAARRPELAQAPGRAETDPRSVLEETVTPGIDIAAETLAVSASATELNRWETDGGAWIT